MNSKEKRLVLELCKFQNQDKSELISLINEGYATSSVLGELFFNRVAAIAHGVLEDAQILGKVNREFRNSLEGFRTLNIEKNKSFLMCLKYVTSILSQYEKEYVMLKGAYLCSMYPKGYRTSNDIDLLVNPKTISKIEKVLLSNGFQQGNIRNGSFIPANRSEILSSKMLRGETVPFIKQVDLPYMKYLEVDINFSLGFTRDDGMAVKEIIDEGRFVELEYFSIRIPSEKHFFLHLCSHLWKEASTYPWIKMKRDMSLYKYCDIYYLMNKMPLEITDEITECAKKYGIEKECYCSLVQTKELFSELNPIYNIIKDKLNISDLDIADYVIAPMEKNLYKYIERSTVERLFSEDRCKLLMEVGEWKP